MKKNGETLSTDTLVAWLQSLRSEETYQIINTTTKFKKMGKTSPLTVLAFNCWSVFSAAMRSVRTAIAAWKVQEQISSVVVW